MADAEISRTPGRRNRTVRVATVRFGTRPPIEMVCLTEQRNPNDVQRWRRIGAATDIMAKVLMLDPAFGANNSNRPAARVSQTWRRPRMIDQRSPDIGKMESRHDDFGGRFPDWPNSGSP